MPEPEVAKQEPQVFPFVFPGDCDCAGWRHDDDCPRSRKPHSNGQGDPEP